MSSLHLRGVQIIPEKVKLPKYLKIRNSTKNVWNPHVLHTLSILHFFDILKNIWDIVWLEYYLDEFIIFKGCSNDTWKNQNPKILKKLVRVWRMWGILTFFVLSPSPLLWCLKNILGHRIVWILFKWVHYN